MIIRGQEVQISTFPCVSKTLGKGFAHRISEPGDGEDLVQAVEGNIEGSGYSWARGHIQHSSLETRNHRRKGR